jgi:heme/copper-type cytochrome/quinol oxidase subunit 2
MVAHAGILGASPTQAMPEYKLVIRNHQFTPSTLTVPANKKIKVLVTNQDSTPSEFESNDFNREKIVLPGSTVTVFVGPLGKGRYKFFDDFHQSTGNGVLIVD